MLDLKAFLEIDHCIRGRSISRYHTWMKYTTFLGKEKVKCLWCGQNGTAESEEKDIADRKAMIAKYWE